MSAPFQQRGDYKVVHMFAGSGGCTAGFDEDGFETIAAVDNDADACADLDYLLNRAVAVTANIMKMEPADLRRICGPRRPDVYVCTPPCLPADGVVLTETGPRRIDTVQAGDRILSHKGRYCNVDKVNVRRYIGTMHGLRLVGSLDTEWYTDEHPIWARTCPNGPKGRAGAPAWTPASKVMPGDRVGFPVPQEVAGTAAAFVGQIGDMTRHIRRGRDGREFVVRSGRTIDLHALARSPDLWYLLGAYLGDGDRRVRNTNAQYEVRFSPGARDSEAFKAITGALERLGLRYHVEAPTDRNVRIRLGSRPLWALCGLLGDGCENKHIPEALMGLEDACMRALVAGLRATDGCDMAGGWKLASISLPLLRGVQRIMLRLGVLGTISRMLRAGKGVIEGREVNIRDSYAMVFFRNPRRTSYWFEDGAVWLRVREVSERAADEPVWNLEVDEDDTYCSPLIATHNCKGWSRLLDKKKRKSPKYVEMCSLAVRAVWLGMYAWDEPPPLIVIENVRGMATEGREMMDIIRSELRRFGYLFDIRTHNVGKLGNLAQSRERCLFVARDPKRCPAFLMVPTEHPLRPCGDELGKLPPPIMDARSESMHRLPQLSARNWLRIAAIRAGKDWKDLPARIRLGGDDTNRHDSKFGVERWDGPAHTVVGVGNRVPSGWSAIQDPRIRPGGATEPRNGNYGVEDPEAPAHTIRGEHRVWSAPASFADRRLGSTQAEPAPVAKPRRARKAAAGQAALFELGAEPDTDVGQPHLHGVDLRVSDHGGDRQNGGFGVNAWERPAHTVVGHADVANTWACASTPLGPRRRAGWAAGRRGDRGGAVDPRLTCKQWAGSYGVNDPAEPSPTILAAMRHDNASASYADPRLGYRGEDDEAAGKHSGRGCYGVVDLAKPAPTIRGHMEVRQAPGAIAAPLPSIDARVDWDPGEHGGRPHNYGVQDWTRPASTIRGKQTTQNSRASVAHPDYPVPTHRLVRDADGELVLLGPTITDWDEICYLVIESEDGSWHRPMTDLELAVLQSLPAEHNGAMLALRGPSGKRREHIGNMLPKAVARAIAAACRATLDQPHAEFSLVGNGKIWVRPSRGRRAPTPHQRPTSPGARAA